MRILTARALTTVTAALCASALLAPAAVADPPVLPAAVDLVGVGTDTTEDFMNQTSADYDAAASAGLPRLYSWDAYASPLVITPKTGAISILRPYSGGAGVSALANNTTATVDYARTARAPQPGDPIGLSFIPFAKDAVTWSAKFGGHAPANLTTTDLRAIYNCAVTNWNQITDVAGYSGPNALIKPFLPPANSDTRSSFLKAIGVTTVGSCVVSGPQADRGTDPALDNPDAVFPYSVGTYIAQVHRGHGSATETPGPLTVRNVNGIAPITSGQDITPALAAGLYGRLLYHAVRTSEYVASNAHATALKSVFGPQGWICNHPLVIDDYGFIPGCPGVIITT
ncbi:substrate-binding domain-containing protein [Kitasatospora sp. NPDC057015]|uniref:substrate-binding domain-containing protein n=1 Tax=Kitasatospora sp. NPDC057015 TaxID=3346001 RepID=UPI0036304B0C